MIEEYVVLTESPKVIQKLLNTWRHTYEINIIAVCPAMPPTPSLAEPTFQDTTYITVILTRELFNG